MSGARLIVLLFNAGPVDISWAKDNPLVDAIFTIGYPAQATGEALFDVLTLREDYANPAGRLVATWPTTLAQVPPMIDYSMNKRTYRYFEGNPMYPFGYGLSYTVFQYSQLQLKYAIIKAGKDLELSVSLSNVGWYTGDEVVQAYISWESPSVTMPKIQLADFKRIERVKIGETVKVTMRIPYQIMAGWKHDSYVIEQGTLNVYVGGQQPFQQTSLPSNILHSKFYITGTKTFN
ncbi:DgyrCDS11927 [Dimorphilus gyrociliatus]|uniref:DgyrCDS11927 n=1 Tax=Dimorphilus gyrociliatus TaxID=2664684 RepID=A0A7I8W4W2_9ANNE|nr:DgyrCDS11927 [Dimorphilus gyrociliatus]